MLYYDVFPIKRERAIKMKVQSLYIQISNQIIQDICLGKLRPNDRIPSESELKALYNVSSVTAKAAFSILTDQGYILRIKGKGSFVNSIDNLNQIQRFIHSKNGRNTAQIKALGLIIPTMKTSVDQNLLDAIELQIAKTPYLLLIDITREDQIKESKAINKFLASGVSGLIIFPIENELYNEDILKLNFNQFPFVFVDRYLKGINANMVTTDNLMATKEAVRHMIHPDFTNIIFISPKSNNSASLDRIKGFEDILQDHNILFNRKNYCMIDLNIHSQKEKYQLIHNHLLQSGNITGIFCANQEMANITAQVLEDHFPSHLNSLDLCCFDQPMNRHFNYIEQDIDTIAKQCVTLLLNAIADDTTAEKVSVDALYIQTPT